LLFFSLPGCLCLHSCSSFSLSLPLSLSPWLSGSVCLSQSICLSDHLFLQNSFLLLLPDLQAVSQLGLK
jgi:hypothetical protein